MRFITCPLVGTTEHLTSFVQYNCQYCHLFCRVVFRNRTGRRCVTAQLSALIQCHYNLLKVKKTHRQKSIRIDSMFADCCITKNFIDPISNGWHSYKACAVPTLIFACWFVGVCWCEPFSCCRLHNSDKNMLIAVGCFECKWSSTVSL